jgi:hypothetical protein
MTTDASQKVV